MKHSQMTPAMRLLRRFGVEALSRWTGRHRSRVNAWTWPTDRGGTGGVIPVRLRAAIAAGALAEQGQVLNPADFELQVGEAYLIEGQPSLPIQTGAAA
jgi:hypothetical protein